MLILLVIAAAARSIQSCLTLCDPIDSSPPGSPIPGILQARTLEWVAVSFSNAWKWKVKVKSLSRVQLLATTWTAAYQAPPSMGFSRQEDWSGVPLPSPTIKSKHCQKQKIEKKKKNMQFWKDIIYQNWENSEISVWDSEKNNKKLKHHFVNESKSRRNILRNNSL